MHLSFHLKALTKHQTPTFPLTTEERLTIRWKPANFEHLNLFIADCTFDNKQKCTRTVSYFLRQDKCGHLGGKRRQNLLASTL
jgi:hypothetical protein